MNYHPRTHGCNRWWLVKLMLLLLLYTGIKKWWLHRFMAKHPISLDGCMEPQSASRNSIIIPAGGMRQWMHIVRYKVSYATCSRDKRRGTGEKMWHRNALFGGSLMSRTLSDVFYMEASYKKQSTIKLWSLSFSYLLCLRSCKASFCSRPNPPFCFLFSRPSQQGWSLCSSTAEGQMGKCYRGKKGTVVHCPMPFCSQFHALPPPPPS